MHYQIDLEIVIIYRKKKENDLQTTANISIFFLCKVLIS